ncbi:HNH endonuclease [Enterococcus phage vB_Efm10_KEN22]
MVFNIIEFSNYQVTKGGIVYNRHNKPTKRKWVGNHIYTKINDVNNKQRLVRVDKLVYQTYVQNPPYDYELEHIDGDEANCKLENLKYIPLNKKE